MVTPLLSALLMFTFGGCVEVSSVEGAGDPALSNEGAAGDPNGGDPSAGAASGPSGDVPTMSDAKPEGTALPFSVEEMSAQMPALDALAQEGQISLRRLGHASGATFTTGATLSVPAKMELGGCYAAAVIITGTLQVTLELYAPGAETPLRPPITAGPPGVTLGGGLKACVPAPDDAKGYGKLLITAQSGDGAVITQLYQR